MFKNTKTSDKKTRRTSVRNVLPNKTVYCGSATDDFIEIISFIMIYSHIKVLHPV